MQDSVMQMLPVRHIVACVMYRIHLQKWDKISFFFFFSLQETFSCTEGFQDIQANFILEDGIGNPDIKKSSSPLMPLKKVG